LSSHYTYIYALVDPVTSEIRYIGKSNHPAQRFEEHMEDESSTPKARWIRALRRRGLQPTLLLLERCDRLIWRVRERKWIAVGHKLEWPLTNSTAGGDGPRDAETSERARRVLANLIRSRTRAQEIA
jgi:hypothetical protein